MPPKRKAAKGKGASAKQVKANSKKAVPKIEVPVDEGFKEATGVVHIADDGVIFDASLNQSRVTENNNKFYRLQLIDCKKKGAKSGAGNMYVHTRWGRVGEFGQVKTMGPFSFEDALEEFNSKFKSKTGLKWEDRMEEPKKNKYTFIEKSYSDDEDEDGDDGVKKEEEEEEQKPLVASKLPIQTQRLMELIFNENHFNSVLESIGYNQEKLPLGKLGKSTIEAGFKHLKELASLIRHPKLAQNKYNTSQKEAIEDFTNRYYSTIPHVFGRVRPPLIDSYDVLQRECTLLDALTDMSVAAEIMKTSDDKHKNADSVSKIDQQFERLKLKEVTPLESNSQEYQGIKNYLINTAGHTHSIRYRVQDIFRIEREGENDRFDKSKFAKMKDSNRRLLWHGSRSTNFGGILSQGLRIAPPEAPVNGYAFGKGVYLADVSTKSANYCVASSSGNHGLLLLCEAELGNPMYELQTGDSGAEELCKKAGSIATFGIGGTAPQDWIDAGREIFHTLKGIKMPNPRKGLGNPQHHNAPYFQLMYNEYICYSVEQIKLRYLIRFSL